ncbi:hypothetical protein J41TS4_46090 [Paenibacillus apis]|uniref:Uncharacterized protein n=1 Tax=Paenibacillus apis TaxID=1792174 RepID=A0A919Y687_9BACL|nr:hypothetical protein J41TS4_46090 [Paenibacillus apis]
MHENYWRGSSYGEFSAEKHYNYWRGSSYGEFSAETARPPYFGVLPYNVYEFTGLLLILPYYTAL